MFIGKKIRVKPSKAQSTAVDNGEVEMKKIKVFMLIVTIILVTNIRF